MQYLRTILLALIAYTTGLAQDQIIPLYPEGIPCANDLVEEVEHRSDIDRIIRKVHRPELHVYRPEIHTGTSVVICPGGGYTILAWDWEGTVMAEWFNSLGITAFVLKYRLPHWESEDCRDKVALLDAQRAIRTVRSLAADFQLDTSRVGVMGFSAGGHLASTLSTHFDYGMPESGQEVDHWSCRPDFSILMYPVITFDTTYGHTGSRRNLIGDNPSPEVVRHFSNDRQVTAETPPTILIHAADDRAVPPQNSVLYYLALQEHHVPAALHIYDHGGHGFSMAKGEGAVENWTHECASWMSDHGFLTAK